MKTPVKVAAFALGLTLVFGAAYGVGALAGPATPPAADSHAEQPHGTPTAAAGEHGGAPDSVELPGGLLVTDRGYTFQPLGAALAAGRPGEFTFRILGPEGRPVTGFDTAHDKKMHLIVVRRDLSGFRHVHPQQVSDGSWQVSLTLPEAGAWRAFADFTPTGGPALTLGVDLPVAGDWQPRSLPAAQRTAEVDGYTVTLDGTLSPGAGSRLTMSVARDGRPVTDLQPYLAAYGHLVALRDGDLAYLHVHPDGGPGDGTTKAGPEIVFHAEVPSSGMYRLFLDFQHGGVVHTVAFTARAGS